MRWELFSLHPISTHMYVFISFDFCLSFASVEALPQSPGFCVAYQFIYLVVLHIVFKAV